MSVQKYKCLGGEISINLPDTVEQFDNLAGESGACLLAANRYVVYHKTLGDAREEVVDACVSAFDMSRKELDSGRKRKSDGAAILVDEDTDSYVKRLFSEKGWDLDSPPKEYTGLVGALEITFDPSQKVREGRAKALPKYIVKIIDEVYTKGTSAKAAGSLGVTLTGDETKDKALLGWALKDREDAKRREEEQRLRGEFVA